MDALAKDAESCSFSTSQRVFKLVALLVPGFPSLDAKLYSPGETQRKRNGAMEYWSDGVMDLVSLLITPILHHSERITCQFVTVGLKCQRPSPRRRRGQRKFMRSLSRNLLRRATATPSAI